MHRLAQAGCSVLIKGKLTVAEKPHPPGEIDLRRPKTFWFSRGGVKRLPNWGGILLLYHGVSFATSHAPESCLPKYNTAPGTPGASIISDDAHPRFAGARGHESVCACNRWGNWSEAGLIIGRWTIL